MGPEWIQDHLADRIGVTTSDLAKCEQGQRSSEFIKSHIGLIADELNLTGQEILDLQSATAADDFLSGIRKPRKDSRARGHKARAFQSLLSLPHDESRQWLRVVFSSNALREQFGRSAPPSQPKTTRKRRLVIDQELVDPYVLGEIRRSLQETCEYARRQGAPLNRTSQMLLYWARSVALLKHNDPSRQRAVDVINDALQESRRSEDRVVQRHLSYALCEVSEFRPMCEYLSETHADPSDTETDMIYMARRSADAGSGLEVLDCALKFIATDRERKLTPLCTLDLRTMARVLKAYRDHGTGASAALSSLTQTKLLASVAAEFVASAQPQWFAAHPCGNRKRTCHELADVYATQILAEIRRFSRTLSHTARALKDAARAR
jgi:hypothetical protein